MICPNRSWTFRVSASTSGVSASSSGSSSNVADQVRVLGDPLAEPDPLQPPDEDPQRPVGHLDHLVDHAPPCRRRRCRPSPGRSIDASRAVTSAEQTVAGDDVVDQLDRPLLADRERARRLREDDHSLSGSTGQRRGQLELGVGELRQLEGDVGHRADDRDRVAAGGGGDGGDRQRDRQDALLVAGASPLRVDVLGQPDLALERAVLDLHLLVDAPSTLADALAGDRQHPLADDDVRLAGSTPGSSTTTVSSCGSSVW